MNVYKVTGSPILHNGNRYSIGQTIELTETDAAKIITFLQLVGKIVTPEKPAVEQVDKVPEAPEVPAVDQSQPNPEASDDVKEETAATEDHNNSNSEEAAVVDNPPVVEESTNETTEDAVEHQAEASQEEDAIQPLTDEIYAAIEADWTVAKLKELLDGNGVEYPKNAVKRTLMDLAWHLIQSVE